MESLNAEIAPFGIHTTVVNPGFFRTELLTEQSTHFAASSIADYDERRGALVEYWKSQNGQQSGDPAKLAQALLTVAAQQPPPRRFIAGADAIAGAEQKLVDPNTLIAKNLMEFLATTVDVDFKAKTHRDEQIGLFEDGPGRSLGLDVLSVLQYAVEITQSGGSETG